MVNIDIPLILAGLGVFILFWRLLPWGWRRKPIDILPNESLPKVSIVVPARNEEHNIERLLKSLQELDYPNYEVVVVNDQSTDRTKEIAESFNVQVIDGESPPEGWNGKNWACRQSLRVLTGDIFLFTDADTVHAKDSLKRAVSFFLNAKADMMSAIPYHSVETSWEKIMGPFHTILLAATAPYSPKPKRLFAIGQYLMFTRESYESQGGHAAVKNEYPDDLALANACMRNKGQFLIFMGQPLFKVRMYAGFLEFISGWRRNFLAGIQQSNKWATIEVTLIFFGLTGAGLVFWQVPHTVVALVGALIIALRQRKWGHFSTWGVVFIPFSLLLFCVVTILAAYDFARGNVLRWKGRAYTNWVTKTES